jgi:hypothetical protein
LSIDSQSKPEKPRRKTKNENEEQGRDYIPSKNPELDSTGVQVLSMLAAKRQLQEQEEEE